MDGIFVGGGGNGEVPEPPVVGYQVVELLYAKFADSIESRRRRRHGRLCKSRAYVMKALFSFPPLHVVFQKEPKFRKALQRMSSLAVRYVY